MSHNYLAIRTEWVPEWTKQNISTYSSARFNKDGSKLLLDNAHNVSTFLKWMSGVEGAEDILQYMLLNSELITAESFQAFSEDPSNEWYQVVNS